MLVISPADYSRARVQIAFDRANKTIAICWLNYTWTPWEYLNPTLVVGVEYRLVERFNGKPVYIQAFDFGTLPNASNKDMNHNISNISKVLKCGGTIENGNSIPYVSQWGQAYVSANNYSVFCYTSNDWTSYTATVWVKYTKTTD